MENDCVNERLTGKPKLREQTQDRGLQGRDPRVHLGMPHTPNIDYPSSLPRVRHCRCRPRYWKQKFEKRKDGERDDLVTSVPQIC